LIGTTLIIQILLLINTMLFFSSTEGEKDRDKLKEEEKEKKEK
jgi:hypothetical protein